MLQLGQPQGTKDNSQYIGQICFTWSMRHLISEAVAFDGQITDQEYKVAIANKRSKNGAVKVTIHHLEGLDPKSQYSLDVLVTDQKVIKEGTQKIAKKKPPMQVQQTFFFPVNDYLQSEFSLILTKTVGFSQKILGQFSSPLKNAIELLEGTPMTIDFNRFKKSDPNDQSPFSPQAYVSISYINSFFTRLSRGKLTIKVKSVRI